MRGYRDPGPEDDADDRSRFEDQFEADEYGLTFRKFGRGRPVRVTPQERDECIDRFERLDAHLNQASFAVLMVWMLAAIRWGGTDVWSQALWVGALAVMILAIRAADRLLWIRLTAHFARRVPVGPERTMMDQYRSKAARLSWPMVGLAAALGATMLWLTDFSRPWHLLERAHLSFALLGLLALSLVKIFDRRR